MRLRRRDRVARTATRDSGVTFRKNRLDEALALAGRDRAESLAGLLEGRVLGTFGRDAELDPLDVLAAGSVGAVGAALDVLLVAVPKSVTYLRRHEQHGSVLTQLFKAWIVPSDNALAAESKVPFDAVGGEPKVPGMFPGNHRFMTPGHDPVLGLAVGVHDILRGGRTAIGTDGRLRFDEISGESVSGLGSALVVELLHLLSDVATKAGLPAPFTTAAGYCAWGRSARTSARSRISLGTCTSKVTTCGTSSRPARCLRGSWQDRALSG